MNRLLLMPNIFEAVYKLHNTIFDLFNTSYTCNKSSIFGLSLRLLDTPGRQTKPSSRASLRLDSSKKFQFIFEHNFEKCLEREQKSFPATVFFFWLCIWSNNFKKQFLKMLAIQYFNDTMCNFKTDV